MEEENTVGAEIVKDEAETEEYTGILKVIVDTARANVIAPALFDEETRKGPNVLGKMLEYVTRDEA